MSPPNFGTYAHRVLGVNADEYAQRIVKDEKPMTHDAAMKVLEGHNIRIHRIVNMFWGRQEMADFFVKWLLTDTVRPDGTPRQGFNFEVKAALLYLSNLHSSLYKFEGNINWSQHPDTW